MKVRLLSLLVLALAATPAGAGGDAKKIPITTSSAEARELYLRARAHGDQLKVHEARVLYEQAVAKDPAFASGHLAVATSAASAQEFFDALERAVALSDKVTEGERLQIRGQDAGARGDPRGQEAAWTRLVELYPEDERAHVLLGNMWFGRQEYAKAIAHYEKAVAIAPSYALPYNQLGYAHRFLGQYDRAEGAFKKYVALVPKDANPLDSYAELLMKMGRFPESIENYRKALALDPRFVASYVGIANDQLLMGKPDEARRTLAKLRDEVAKDDGERRQALLWTAATYVHEGNVKSALATLEEMAKIAERGGDLANLPGDHVQMGLVHLHAGDADRAEAEFRRAVERAEKAEMPPEAKENVRRNHLYFQAWTALVRKDARTAAVKRDAFRAQVDRNRIPFEVRRVHELDGLVALAEGRHAEAVAALGKANLQDPVVVYHLALAHQGAGDREKARELCRTAAEFNELNFNHAFVRRKAKEKLPTLAAR